MMLDDFIKQNNLDKNKLKPMIAKVTKEMYPTLIFNSDEQAYKLINILDLDTQTFNIFIYKLSKYVKLWSFS